MVFFVSAIYTVEQRHLQYSKLKDRVVFYDVLENLISGIGFVAG